MKQKVLKLLSGLCGKSHVRLTNSGNSAIFLSLLIAKSIGKKKIAIPDQGGWLTFKGFPADLNLKTIEIKTDYGVVDLKGLEKNIDGKTALLITNMAGYIAQQPIGKIAELCRKKGCLFIVDNTDSIFADGSADIYIGSFGVWKPVNLGHGGFIAANRDFFQKIDKEYFLMLKFDENKLKELYEKLIGLNNRLESFFELNEKIKKDLWDFDIIHRDKKGINVAVKFKNHLEKNKILKYCRKNNLEHTLCPRYIRVNEKAVSIEVKRA